MAVPLAKDGRREVLGLTILLWALIALTLWLAGGHALGWAVAVLLAAVWAWVIWFFRDPQRVIPDGPNLFVSPADGHVSDITPIGPDSELGRPGVRIGVFMDVFSVHVNRAPCEATVTGVSHKSGRFLDVRDAHAYEVNEAVTIRMNYVTDGLVYPVAMRQVAGMVARRIVNHLSEGQPVGRGQRIGMIKFGSRCELLLPTELAGDIRVVVGQKVQAGASVLAAHASGQEASA